MRQTLSILKTVAIAVLSASAIVVVGQGAWGALVFANIATSPSVPWAPVVMVGVLALLLGVLGGWIGPRRGADARRELLALKPAPLRAWVWSLIAGGLAIGACAGLWIVFGELVPVPPNLLTDASHLPRATALAFLAVAILAAPLSEEAAMRGYAMGMIRKVMPDGWTLIVVSMMFALIHLTQGPYLTKQAVYFLAGLALGFTRLRTGSLIPAMVVHSAADLTFFTLVWPNDAHRPHVTLASADAAFWLQVALVLGCGLLALAAYVQLARVTRPGDADRPSLGALAAA
jgi:membrane protease YdiL (CAAX protease family)